MQMSEESYPKALWGHLAATLNQPVCVAVSQIGVLESAGAEVKVRRGTKWAELCQVENGANWSWPLRGAQSSKQRWGCGSLASTLSPLGGLLWGRAACHLFVVSWVHQSGRDLRLEPCALKQMKSETESTAPHWGAERGHRSQQKTEKRGEDERQDAHRELPWDYWRNWKWRRTEVSGTDNCHSFLSVLRLLMKQTQEATIFHIPLFLIETLFKVKMALGAVKVQWHWMKEMPFVVLLSSGRTSLVLSCLETKAMFTRSCRFTHYSQWPKHRYTHFLTYSGYTSSSYSHQKCPKVCFFFWSQSECTFWGFVNALI